MMKNTGRFLLCLALCLALGLCAALAEEAAFETLVLDTAREATVGTGGETVCFRFVPDTAGYYTFFSSGDLDTVGYVYDADMKSLASNDDGGENRNFSVSFELVPDTVYYFGARLLSSSATGTFDVTVTRTAMSGACGEKVTWELDEEKNLLIRGSGPMMSASADSYPWYPFRKEILQVTVYDGVTGIGKNAFQGCTALVSASIASSVEAIGSYAFYGCSALTHAALPEGITAIENDTFSGCTRLVGILWPSSLRSIGNRAFSSCASLEAADFPDTLEAIGETAFSGCSSLERLVIPPGVKTIPQRAFSRCVKLRELTAEGVETIGRNAFEYAYALESVSLPSTLTGIGEDAFLDSRALETVVCAAARESVDIAAGNGMIRRGLGDRILDSGSAGADAVWSLDRDGRLLVTGTGTMEDYKARTSLGSVTGGQTPWAGYRMFITDITVGGGITSVGSYAFAGLEKAVSVTLPETLSAIGDYGLFWTGVSTLRLPSGLKSIGARGLMDNSHLTELTLPEGLETIGEGAFARSHCRSMTLPVSLKIIPDSAFYYCTSLSEVHYRGTEAQWRQITVGEYNECLTGAVILYGVQPAPGVLSGACGENVTWSLTPDGVLTVSGQGAMADYTLTKASGGVTDTTGYNPSITADTPWKESLDKVTRIVVEEGVTRIGTAAFFNCHQARSVSLPGTLQSVGGNAFRCTGITSLSLPDTVSVFGAGACYGCYALREVRLSASLGSIPSDAFAYCGSLLRLEVPEGVRSISGQAFSSSGILYLSLPSTLQSADGSMGLSTGVHRSVEMHFHGPVPRYLGKDQLLRNRIICEPAYYEDYKAYLFPYVRSMSPDGYSNNETFGVLTDTATPPSISADYAVISDTRPSLRLEVRVGQTAASGVVWESTDPSVVAVSEHGVLTPAAAQGGAVVFTQAEWQGTRTLLMCQVKVTVSNLNALMMGTLPTEGIEPNLAASSSVSSYDENNTLLGYQPCLYVENDKDSEDYQELLALTRSLTEGCTTDREKAQAILSWIGSHITYSTKSLCIGESASQAYAVYHSGEGNCQGFSKLAGFMLSLAGVPSAMVTNRGHMWNAIYLDGSWTMADAQLGGLALYSAYSDMLHAQIETITFAQGEGIYMVTQPGTVWLAGVGENILRRDGITSLEVAEFATVISSMALQDCHDLVSVTIPQGVTVIRGSAFANCGKLERVVIPDSVTEISPTAFRDSAGVTIVCTEGSAAQAFALENGLNCQIVERVDGEVRVLTLPSSLMILETGSLAGLSSADLIVIPENILFIADDALEGTKATLSVAEGSYAQEYAEENGIPYVTR